MIKQVVVPDISGAIDVDVIELLVSPGDKVAKEDSLITLEGEKATMEIPSPFDGVVKEMKLAVGDKVSEGSLILTLESEGAETQAAAPKAAEEPAQAQVEVSAEPVIQQMIKDVLVPDISGAVDVDVIEVTVATGDKIAKEDPLITLEGEKATMEIPSPYEGEVKEVKISVGDKVSQGSLILTMEVMEAGAAKQSAKPTAPAQQPENKAPSKQAAPQAAQPAVEQAMPSGDYHASPSVRRFARELGVDLRLVKGSARKGRIIKQDVQAYVKAKLQNKDTGGSALPVAPKVDFTKFGDVEVKALSKIKKLTGKNLSRNWLLVPHVTQFDEADITEMEAFRQANKKEAEKQGYKLTPLVFLIKAVVSALKEFPHFNSSLDETGENLIVKKYFNIGVAVDTPNGLVVPVLKDANKKGIYELAQELATVSKKARETGLALADMQGSCFTISSLGGVGGTAFTPIVNLPDVSILGVSRSQMKPVYDGKEFQPRLMLPLSLSYDHRVIDGAEGARFTSHIVKVLGDIRRLLL